MCPWGTLRTGQGPGGGGGLSVRRGEAWGSGAQEGEAPPMPPHLPQRARSEPASHPLARPGPHRPAEAILLRPPQVPAQRPKMEPDLAGAEDAASRRPPDPWSLRWKERRGDWGGGAERWRGRWPRSPGPAPALHLLRRRPAPPPIRRQVLFLIAPPLSPGSPPTTRPSLRSAARPAPRFLTTPPHAFRHPCSALHSSGDSNSAVQTPKL